MKPIDTTFGELTALTFDQVANPSQALVLLHGVGSNERNLFETAPLLSNNRMLVSLRAPLSMGPGSFGWFHVQFTPQGPIHNWSEAKISFGLIEDAIRDLSRKSAIPLQRITVFGFSQGAILTIGLTLCSELDLESYVASSGRTLPEFAEAYKVNPLPKAKDRKVFLSHGMRDSKLPIDLARNSAKILKQAKIALTYREYPSGHEISADLLQDVKSWIEQIVSISKFRVARLEAGLCI